MSRRPPRTLSDEERSLWREVARTVAPLVGRPVPQVAADERTLPTTTGPAPPVVPPSSREPPARDLRRLLASVASPVPAPALERRLRTGLRRGTVAVDAVLDLHGMRQAEAHGALRAFLLRAQRGGHRLVLVVTGKGGSDDVSDRDPFGERGVLRRSVPLWLAAPDLRHLVIGVEEAGRRHGGGGALYLRLRRGPFRD